MVVFSLIQDKQHVEMDIKEHFLEVLVNFESTNKEKSNKSTRSFVL